MDQLIRLMLAQDPGLPWQTVFLSILMAFVLAMVIAWVYVQTHQSLSYSRLFVQALVLGGIVGAMLMMAIGNNVARGIGIVGTLAIIRFRSTMKDPRDMMFVFAGIGVGIATGVRAYAVALAGTTIFAGAAFLMKHAAFGARQSHDGQLRVQVPSTPESDAAVKAVLRTHCRNWTLVALRDVEQGNALEHCYQVSLRDPALQTLLIQDLESLPAARGISLFLQQATVEL